MPEEERLVDRWSCTSYMTRIPSQGHLYISLNYIGFYSYILGKETKRVISFIELEEIKWSGSNITLKTKDGIQYNFTLIFKVAEAYRLIEQLNRMALQQKNQNSDTPIVGNDLTARKQNAGRKLSNKPGLLRMLTTCHISEEYCKHFRLPLCDEGEVTTVLREFLNGIYNADNVSTPVAHAQSVQTLIHAAYTKYGREITQERLDELRNKHRRLTIRNNDMDADRVMLKNYADNVFFDRSELQLLLSVIREERMAVKKVMQQRVEAKGCEAPLMPSPSKMCLGSNTNSTGNRSDAYRVDYDTFRVLFNELTPWRNARTLDLAEKLFRLTDKKNTGVLEFEQLLNALGIICSSKCNEKFKLLYILHLPPLLSKVEIDHLRRNKAKSSGKDEYEEEAIEAEDFFDYDPLDSIEELPSPSDNNFNDNDFALIEATRRLHQMAGIGAQSLAGLDSSYSPTQTMPTHAMYYDDVQPAAAGSSLSSQAAHDGYSDISDFVHADGLQTPPLNLNVETISNFSQISDIVTITEKMTRTDSNADSKSLASLRYLLAQPSDRSTNSTTNIPNMKKTNFQLLWRSLLEILGDDDEDIHRAYEHIIELGNNNLKKIRSFESFTQLHLREGDELADKNGNPTSPMDPLSLFAELEERRRSTTTQESDNKRRNGSSSSDSSDVWEISINQFIAAVLSVSSILRGFSKSTSIKENLTRIQVNRRKCVASNY